MPDRIPAVQVFGKIVHHQQNVQREQGCSYCGKEEEECGALEAILILHPDGEAAGARGHAMLECQVPPDLI